MIKKPNINDPSTWTTTDYILEGQNVIGEIVKNGLGQRIQQVEYLIGTRGVEYRRTKTYDPGEPDPTSDVTKWMLYDGLGSVIGEVGEPAAGMDEYGVILRDGSGRPLYFDVSDAYVGGVFCYKVPENLFLTTPKMDVYGGPRRPDPSPTVGKHRFVGGLGHTTEPDTGGLIYMRARWMDPVTGRFISEDPGRDGANWYMYCRNNPVNLVDVSGEYSWQVDLALFAIGVIINPPFATLMLTAAMAAVTAAFAAAAMPAVLLGEANATAPAYMAALGTMSVLRTLNIKMSTVSGITSTTIMASGAAAYCLNVIGIMAAMISVGDVVNKALNN